MFPFSASTHSQHPLRHRARAALVGAAVLLPFYAYDIQQAGFSRLTALAARTAWIGVFLALAWAVRRDLDRPVRYLTVAAGAVSGAATLGMVAAAGGQHNPFFGYVYTIPFAVALLLPDAPGAVAACTVTVLVGGVVLHLADGLKGVPWWGAMVAASGLGAAWLSLLVRRTHAAELAAERARAAALEALATSERRRAHAERLATAGRLAARVAHEVNNPLTVLQANLAWLADPQGEAADPEEREEVMVDLRQAARRIRALVQDLKVFTAERGEDGTEADVARAVERALGLHSGLATRGVAVEVAGMAGLPPVRLGENRLVGVLVQLLQNAADALRDVGSGGRVRVKAERNGATVTLAVEDNGPGFSPEALAHLFEPFFTTRGLEGRGLALALAHEEVCAAGGALEAHNLPEGGARVVLTLPCGEPSVPRPPGDSAGDPDPPR